MEMFMSSKLIFHLKFLIFLLLLLLSGTENSKITRCREKERQALAMFKEGLTDEYGRLSSWQTRDCCEWKGVRCSNLTGHVIELHLSSLRGKLSPSLLELEYLTYLDLSRLTSSFYGSNRIPEFIGSLKRLKHLDLSMGDFYGEIPIQLGNLSNLQYLDLSNDFHSYLSVKNLNWLSDLSSLRYLALSGANLSMAHDWIQAIDRLPFLRELKLARCVLPTITSTKFVPSSFNFSRSLISTLDLSSNNLGMQLTNSIGNLSTLRYLDLYYNEFSGTIPASIGNLIELQVMNFYSSGFIGSVTEVHLHNLSKLTYLELSQNSLNLELNSDWVPPFNLIFLGVRNCKIGPYFPSWLKTQTYLRQIDLSGCGIDDVLPNWFSHIVPQLDNLNLSNNQIRGNLSFGNLQTIDLRSNKFQGPITSVCNFSTSYYRAYYIDLSRNHFSGTVPNCLIQLKNLFYLNLGNNKFSGKLPCSIGQLTLIQSFHLRNNSLDGQLPPSLQQCKLLRVIDFGHNKFRGKIPRWLGTNLQNLLILSLPSNQLEGTIPSTLCHLKELRILDLSNNSIYGKLPNCLGNLTSMAEKGNPPFSVLGRDPSSAGEIYQETGLLVWKGMELEYYNNLLLVKSFDLSNNRLSGEIPIEITYLEDLKALNFSGNNLQGNIPQEIGRLRQLDFLDLSRNQLSGVIPLSLSELSSIGFLNLSTNNLSGRIPSSTQLPSFNPSSYLGNPGLCGLPLPKLCLEDQRNFPPRGNRYPHQVEEDEEEWFKSSSFYIATGIGFAVGLWGTLGSLLVNRSWRVNYFRFVSNIHDSLYVSIVLKIAKLRRLLKN